VPLFYAGDQRAASTFLGELRARVPEDAAVYTWDNPGFLGFFSGRHVVDGDGLVNDAAYAERLRSGTLAGYFDEQHICWFIGAQADADPLLDVAGLELTKEEATLVFAVKRERASQADFALYRICP